MPPSLFPNTPSSSTGHYQYAFTPTFRGYDSYLGYYTGGEDYFTHTTSDGFDLHYEPQPQCGANCSQLLWNENVRMGPMTCKDNPFFLC